MLSDDEWEDAGVTKKSYLGYSRESSSNDITDDDSNKDIVIRYTVEDSRASRPTRFSITRSDREAAQKRHREDLIRLLSSCVRLDAAACHGLVQSAMLSLTPDDVKPRFLPEVRSMFILVVKLMRWVRRSFRVVSVEKWRSMVFLARLEGKGGDPTVVDLIDEGEGKEGEDAKEAQDNPLEELLLACRLRTCTPDHLAVLFCAQLRACGIESRVVTRLDPVSLRPWRRTKILVRGTKLPPSSRKANRIQIRDTEIGSGELRVGKTKMVHREPACKSNSGDGNGCVYNRKHQISTTSSKFVPAPSNQSSSVKKRDDEEEKMMIEVKDGGGEGGGGKDGKSKLTSEVVKQPDFVFMNDSASDFEFLSDLEEGEKKSGEKEEEGGEREEEREKGEGGDVEAEQGEEGETQDEELKGVVEDRKGDKNGDGGEEENKKESHETKKLNEQATFSKDDEYSEDFFFDSDSVCDTESLSSDSDYAIQDGGVEDGVTAEKTAPGGGGGSKRRRGIEAEEEEAAAAV
eukprot:CAMPEP_0175046494 /NCGR_PEP_ID=MMETSP0052_2-20121109/5063_1 /TAXON_ID=51329 ORGANISM="Polytomella parva, Strain SAG 63-3" /NCGR_SAMPLE_ID=MMETSP0052_2 /ASSEMBLY_ACC=CAM_ASM_000194 /LENGTH=516 /DNA_ID=CAMNT_0016310249 /DNA_START=111 /DNA_END=1658 /DNA_ORIENTATION=+